MRQPLDGLFVLDFSTLLPGPLASLMLSAAGADVVKIERPGTGEDMRDFPPQFEGASLGYAVLNQGKKSIALDLKSKDAVGALTPLIKRADVLVEQFRPGVMDRFGLGYEAVRKINPKIIYCSITGYGQTGPKRLNAGHDLNYMGDSGLLSTSRGPKDNPTLPPALIADVGGGSYPAVINILLALLARDQTGDGTHIDIAMAENVFAFSYWGFTQGAGLGEELPNGGELLSGGSPRYQLYPTSDDRLIAVGAIEQKFWEAFCGIIDLPAELCDDAKDPEGTITAIGDILRRRSAKEWEPLLKAGDCCCTIVRNMNEVRIDPHYIARGVFDRPVAVAGLENGAMPALPIPVAPQFRGSSDAIKSAPDLGADNDALGITQEGITQEGIAHEGGAKKVT